MRSRRSPLLAATPPGELAPELAEKFPGGSTAIRARQTAHPLSALTRSTADKLLADHTIRALMAEAMDELAAVGAAIDCPISESAEDRMEVTQRLGAFKSSRLQDVEAGRPIELEALLGAPREIARHYGIRTPALDRLYGVTRLMTENLGLLPA